MKPCPVCGIAWGYRAACESPACPCYGLRAASAEAELAAAQWRSRPSVAAARCLSGADALAALERGAQLDYWEAAGEVIRVEIEHQGAP